MHLIHTSKTMGTLYLYIIKLKIYASKIFKLILSYGMIISMFKEKI